MTKEPDILQLQQELAYYKKQFDSLSGNTISTQYTLAQLSNTCKKYINGFHIMAEIQRSFSFYSLKEVLYEQFLESLYSQMFLNRAVLLEVIPGTKTMRPVLQKGFTREEEGTLKTATLLLPDTFFQEKKSILVNSATVSTSEFIKEIQVTLFTPYFILLPLIKNQQVWGGLYVGMQQEFKPVSYLPFSLSNIEMFESIAGLISSMIQQLEQREIMEKERNRIARDMHDDLGSELSRISVTCENLKSQFTTNEPVLKSLEVIKESTVSIVNNIGNIIWALNPVNNSLDSLLAYLREYTFDYLELNKLAVKFDMPVNAGDRILPHELRTHIFMVVKEALHNIVKHATAISVGISIKVTPGSFSCTITDNGKGFDHNNTRPFGNGMRNMNQRITEAGGRIKLDSKTGKGTTILFELPL